MRPGLANAFLLGFIESMADFGNPLVLGGNFDVLSTEIFFAIVGAQNDQGRAAVLAIVLLVFTLGAFYLQRFWLGRKAIPPSPARATAGASAMPRGLAIPVYAVVRCGRLFTVVVYVMILYGGFVQLWGVDDTLTFKHYLTRLFPSAGARTACAGPGSAWDSFWTTIQIADCRAADGCHRPDHRLPADAPDLCRQARVRVRHHAVLRHPRHGDRRGLSSWPSTCRRSRLTGTGLILVISFIFRNMPVGVRAGIASMSQLDKSLDESSLTLGANSWQTFRGDPAAAAPGDPRRAGLQLRAGDDGDQRR
jgi:iron(III) transport system permease protein